MLWSSELWQKRQEEYRRLRVACFYENSLKKNGPARICAVALLFNMSARLKERSERQPRQVCSTNILQRNKRRARRETWHRYYECCDEQLDQRADLNAERRNQRR